MYPMIWRTTFRTLLALLLLLAIMPSIVLSQTPRSVINIAQNWRFHRGLIAGVQPGRDDDTAWEKVTIPHSWSNAEAVPGKDFYTGESWYSDRFVTAAAWKGKRVFSTI